MLDRNVALVRWYVRLAITLRVVGGVAGAYLGYLADRAFGADSSAGAGFWTWVIGGWLVGALWAQRQVAAPTTGTGVASLTPRRLSDYLPVGLRWAPLAATSFVAASTIAIRVTFASDIAGRSTPSTATVAVPILLAVGAIVSWRSFTYRSWQVRRSVGTAPPRIGESAPT